MKQEPSKGEMMSVTMGEKGVHALLKLYDGLAQLNEMH